MQLIFLFIGFISLFILIYSINLLIKQFKLKEIAIFDIGEVNKSFKIVENGIHSVSIIGLSSDLTVDGLNAEINLPNGKEITLVKNKMRYSFHWKRTIAFEQWNFKTNFKGIHKLTLGNLEEFLLENPILKSRKPFSKRKAETRTLKILIKQSLSTKHRLILIIGLVIGINGLFWGLLIGIYPDIFH